jgi:Ca2+-transporting ATPase
VTENHAKPERPNGSAGARSSSVVRAIEGKPHALSAAAVLAALVPLGADGERGLSQGRVDELRARFGRNELAAAERESLVRKFLEQFANPFVGALLAAAAVAVLIAILAQPAGVHVSFLARFGDAIAILLIVIANAVLGFMQELRAERALDALSKLSAPMAHVVRDGEKRELPASELVPGDLVELEAGALVPADVRLLESTALAADESALTGESTPVSKDAREIGSDDAPIGERAAMLFLGTTIVAGRARAVVVATGAATELGHVGELIALSGDDKTPLERRLEDFGGKILWTCLAISVALFVYGLATHSKPWHLLLLEAVSLAVAAIPEGLPAITTITLALGMRRMADHGAQVRKLNAVETLGSASVICSDKTGTLTQNEMTVREAWAGGVRYRVTGLGYDPDGAILRDDAEPQAPHLAERGDGLDAPLDRLLRTAALCNNARFVRDDDGVRRVIGDPTEGALLVLAEKGAITRESVIEKAGKVVSELPFDSDRKRMTVIALDAKGREIAHVKGGVDVLLPRCTTVKMGPTESGDVPLTEAHAEEIRRVADEMGAKALRVLALARRRNPEGDPEEQLTFLGLVGMIDPPRPGVKKAIATCARAGVRVVMITGDHRVTAEAIARDLGILAADAGPSAVMTGAEIEAADAEAFAARVPSVRVFARVSAEHKLRIVRALKARGEVVAMTGDGVNDAPAIREAQIGVAMGLGGTDVAREAADLVLLDNNFSTIVEAIREGRAIYRNIQKFIYFLLSSNAGLVITVFITGFSQRLPDLTPLQILWINLVTNGLPALALGIDPPEAAQMEEAPRPLSEGLLLARDYWGILGVGVAMAAFAMAVLHPLSGHGVAGDDLARAMAFSILAISPLFHAFNCRSATESIRRIGVFTSRPLLVAVAISLGIHLVALLVPSLWPVFRTVPMSGAQWLTMVALSAAIVPLVEVAKIPLRRRQPNH